ncbi:MAG: hypothetical protein PHY48_12305, partial [Candidatus Cloacimonetes bacterium]|nr:hypothetical protein [Candidatus Cloacimonadota bacterium]
EYAYDYQSRRISKTTLIPNPYSSLTTKYIWDGWNIAAEIIIDQTIFTTNISYYTWGLDLSGTRQGAGGVGGLLCETKTTPSSTNTYCAVGDANGNVTEYIDNTGTVKAHYEYSAFGEITAEIGFMAADFTHRFSTKPFDKKTRLVQYQYRPYYAPNAKWLTKDSIEERGGVNIYGLLGNDAINKWDYLGLALLADYYYKVFYGVGPAKDNGTIGQAPYSLTTTFNNFTPPDDAVEGRKCAISIKSDLSSSLLREASKYFDELYVNAHANKVPLPNPNFDKNDVSSPRTVYRTQIVLKDGNFYLNDILDLDKSKVKAKTIYPFVCFDAFIDSDNVAGIDVQKLYNNPNPNPSAEGFLATLDMIKKAFTEKKCECVTVFGPHYK